MTVYSNTLPPFPTPVTKHPLAPPPHWPAVCAAIILSTLLMCDFERQADGIYSKEIPHLKSFRCSQPLNIMSFNLMKGESLIAEDHWVPNPGRNSGRRNVLAKIPLGEDNDKAPTLTKLF